MKYLKTYENINNPYEKYGVWEKKNPHSFVLVKIAVADIDKFKIETIYIFNKEKEMFVSPEMGSRKQIFYNEYVKRHIIFSSNNMDDCKNQILLLTTSNKYNL